MPDGSWTTDPDEYGEAWAALGDKVAKLFPGYTVDGFNPGIRFNRWEVSTRTGKSQCVDSFSLSVMAINTLLSGEEPPCILRDDF